jgi:hypothetical protein
MIVDHLPIDRAGPAGVVVGWVRPTTCAGSPALRVQRFTLDVP